MKFGSLMTLVGFVAHNRDRVRRKIWGKHYTFDKRGATRKPKSMKSSKRRGQSKSWRSHQSTIR